LSPTFPEGDRRTDARRPARQDAARAEDFGAGYALMAGQITPRRLFKGLHPDLKAARILLSLKRRNAETIFGAIAAEIEALGISSSTRAPSSTTSWPRPAP
jgi:hypothetical protein